MSLTPIDDDMEPTPEDVAEFARAANAMQLRVSGASYADIASQCGYLDAQSAAEAVEKYIDRNMRGITEDVILLELRRLDELTMTLMVRAGMGDMQAANAMIKLMERRSKMLGLDQATKSEVSVDASPAIRKFTMNLAPRKGDRDDVNVTDATEVDSDSSDE